MTSRKPSTLVKEEVKPHFSKKDIIELKAMKAPPREVRRVLQAAGILLGYPSNQQWREIKDMFKNVNQFMDQVTRVQPSQVTQKMLREMAPILDDPNFTVSNMLQKSKAASSVSAWIIHVYNIANTKAYAT